MNKKGKSGVVITFGIVFFIALFVMMLGFDTVDASHLGVQNRFGVIQGVQQPGMQWTGLFTSVYQYDLRMRQTTVEMLQGEKTSVDFDGQTVKARIQVNYRINPDNVQKLYESVGQDNGELEDILNIDGIIREGFKTATSKYRSEEIWQKRNEVKQEAISIIENNFPEEYFILENVIISDLGFNDEFIAAIEQRKTNEQLALAEAEAVVVAQRQAEKAVEQARGTAESKKLAAEAEAYQIEVRARAEAKALELKRKELDPLMVQNNWIDAWDGALPKYMLSSNTDMLMQMPLEE